MEVSDFRVNLVPIFVDNLNPKVDQIGLWGIFKPFGLVKDVFLSSKFSLRRSRFAFIRFGTVEEANKVVELTNGMYVCGWPVVVKIASYGWKNRRSLKSQKEGTRRSEVLQSVKGRNRGGRDEDGNKRNRSFADVLKGSQMRRQSENEKVEEKVSSMSWSVNQVESDWLKKCAIGVLKEFSKVDSVNLKLSSGGFSFSSIYLGAKNILWCFELESDKEGFIKNKFLWDDCFSSMCDWSDAFTPQTRLAWVNCWGISLSCWCPSLFKRLGWMIGEPLVIEEDTLARRRLDRGRILVAIPLEQSGSCKINMDVDGQSFLVKVVEDMVPVNLPWIERFLGLVKESSPVCLNLLQEKDAVEGAPTAVVGEMSSLNSSLGERDKRKQDGKGQHKKEDMMAVRGSGMSEIADHSGEGVISKRCGSLGGKDNLSHYVDAGAVSDKYFEGVLGQDRGEGPSEEKCREEVVNCGPIPEFSSKVSVLSGTPNLFQVDSSMIISESEGYPEKRKGRKSSASKKRHNMILRSSRVCDKMKQCNPETFINVDRNLEDEVVKVLEKGMALGCNFNGKKKELLEIMARRDEVNDNRFRDLVRRLVLIHKSSK